MKRWLCVLLAGLALISVAASASEDLRSSPERARGDCHGPYKDKVPPHDAIKPTSNLCGANLTKADLIGADLSRANLTGAVLFYADLTEAKLLWADLTEANLSGAKLDMADLTGADLSRANLSRANLTGADLSRANLSRAILTGAVLFVADLTEANLSGAKLDMANLREARLAKANLNGAVLYAANLTGADLIGADLTEANLTKADLTGADLTGADLTGAIFDLSKLPIADNVATALGLDTMIYKANPASLVKLRKEFRENGYNYQENAVTAAIKRSEQAQLLESVRRLPIMEPLKRYLNEIEYYLKEIAFEIPTAWGSSPSRALLLMLALIPVFAVPYILVVSLSFSRAGIWRKWADTEKQPPKMVNHGYLYSTIEPANNKEPEKIHRKWGRAIFVGLYFSLLSATRIGWRELTIGSWLERIQVREYSLYAKGWIRPIAGLQSLISVYLIAMWAMTTFGHPFE